MYKTPLISSDNLFQILMSIIYGLIHVNNFCHAPNTSKHLKHHHPKKIKEGRGLKTINLFRYNANARNSTLQI